MHDEIHDALEPYDAKPVRELHRIRPHATYEIRFRGERAVCKLATHPLGTPALEGRLLRYVDQTTTVPVPEVVAVGDDHFVARWCAELPDGTPSWDEQRVRALGRGLATLHIETANDFDRTGRFRTGTGALDVAENERWSDTLLDLLARRERFLETVGYGHLAREAAEVVRANRPLLDAVDDAVLVHGNYFGEHVATADDGVRAVIDFEHALVGSPGWDYLRTAAPVFGSNADHDIPERQFREAYELVRPLPPRFDERRALHELVNGVSYLRSLHLQRGNRDATQTVARRANGLATWLNEKLAAFEKSGT